MDVRFIEVPYHAGDDAHPSSSGPRHLVQGGAAAAMAKHHAVSVETIDRGEPFRDTASSSASVNRRLADSVRSAMSAGRFPFILAGSCTASHGVLAAIGAGTTGAVWIDAHADFNTTETSVSGFFPGMSLAIATGHCYRGYYTALPAVPLREDAVALFGVRDFSPPAERDRLGRSAIHVVEWVDYSPAADIHGPLDRLAGSVSDVYLHIDMDAFAPEIAPSVADEPVPGGLTLEHAEDVVRATAERFDIAAATVATYAPSRDPEAKTLTTAVRVVELISRCLTDRSVRRGSGRGHP